MLQHFIDVLLIGAGFRILEFQPLKFCHMPDLF